MEEPAAAADARDDARGCCFSRYASPTLRVRLGPDHDACATHQMQALHRSQFSSAGSKITLIRA